MEDWMACVPTRSLERGCDRFESGCVHAVEHRFGGWHATVSGGNDYVVIVPASLDPREAQCTCPHYADGNICKHIVAAFIAVESIMRPFYSSKDASALVDLAVPRLVQLQRICIDDGRASGAIH